MRDQIVRVKRFEKVPLILVGNKVDLESEREVAGSDGRALAQEWGCPFIETSAQKQEHGWWAVRWDCEADELHHFAREARAVLHRLCCAMSVLALLSIQVWESKTTRKKQNQRSGFLFYSHLIECMMIAFFQNVQNIEICFISLHKIVVYDLIYTLTGHFIRYTLLVPGLDPLLPSELP